MKISDFKDEEALDLLADLIEPAAHIFGNEKMRDAVKAKKPALELARLSIKENKKEVIEILARLNGVPVEEYHCTIASIIKDVLDILNDKDLVDFFSSQVQMTEQTSSISVMPNTEGKRK